MNDQEGARPERRRHVRIAPKGTVILNVANHSQRGRLANLSEGGMYVVTDVTVPERLLGRATAVEVRLDGMQAEWIRATSTIIRIGPAGVGLAFEVVPAVLLRLIDDMSTKSRARLRVLGVVLVDQRATRRAAMAEAFRASGCTVVETATPLEAIVRLGESHFEPDLIAIGDSLPGTIADDLRAFVERDHPHAKLVHINDDLTSPDGVLDWLSAADPDSDLTNRVREMLGRPRRVTRP